MNKKIAVVTGASRGIGKAIATALTNDFFVIGTATSSNGANDISEFLGQDGMGLVLNQNDTTSIDNFVAAIKDKPVSVLINNAGITKDNLFLRMKDEEWNDVIGTNLTGVFYLTRALIPTMSKAKWGRIVNISSVVASSSNFGQSNYIASKAGLEGFSKALALEFASRNITVNSVAPGFIETDMTEKLTDEQKNKIMNNIPMKKMGASADIASAVKFLVSDDASYITGIVLHINGGLYIK